MRTKLLLVISLLLVDGAAQAQLSGESKGNSVTGTEIKKGSRPKFGGVQLDFSISDGTGLNQQNYNNSLSLFFEPTWAIGKMWLRGTRFSTLSLSARFFLDRQLRGYNEGAYSEYSDNGLAVRCSNLQVATNGTIDPRQVQRCQYDSNYRWDYSDLWFTLRNPRIYTIPVVKINLNPSIRGIIPVSAESRYETMRFVLSGFLGANRAFLSDRISLGYTFGFTKYFHEYTTPGQARTGAPLQDALISNGYQYSDIAPTTVNFLTDPSHVGTIGGYNADFGFQHMFNASFDITSKLNLDVLYIIRNTYAYEAKCGLQEYGGVITDACANANAAAKVSNGVGTAGRGHSDTQILWITLGYQVFDWFNINVSWVNWAPLRKPDNSFRQGIISTNYDAYTNILIGTTFSIDKILGKFL